MQLINQGLQALPQRQSPQGQREHEGKHGHQQHPGMHLGQQCAKECSEQRCHDCQPMAEL